jgi:hypothetical protein
MIKRVGTPYRRLITPPDKDVSDMELYEEARLLDHEEYIVVPYARGVSEVMQRIEDGPISRTIASEEVSKRL